MSCEVCKRPACVHVTEVDDGHALERHFCQQHAEEYLGTDVYGRVASPFSFSSLSPEAYDRLARVLDDSGLLSGQPQDVGAQAVPALVSLLGDEEACLRYYAAGWLGEMAGDAAEALDALQLAASDTNPYVRDAVAAAIARIKRRRRPPD